MASYEETLAKIYEERLCNFYKKYDESKLQQVPTLLTKYKGKEEQLLRAMVQKYGPEPTPEELAEDDDDEEDVEEATQVAGSKDEGVTEIKEELAEDDDDDDDDLAEEDDEPPFKLIYCDVCGLPPEYCEYGDNYEKCVPWIKENCPHLLKECISVDTKKKNKRGGGVLKKKELSEDKIRLIVYTETRSRKKTVTVVDGLETFGIKLKDAAKIFGRKFASSSSVKDKDTGGSEVVIQGDVIFDLPDLLQSEFKIPQSKLFTKEGGKIVPLR
uniref:SUI1 domain-containing protein n=1 Tax=Aureoumbra lagunensis TaxID=44058 RepID=A0A7S3JYQ1_9STRA|eukprot:CAMPEP_0197305460 /NCGR_PEP_ID=MMETSP0891-20130614/1519_1 /TAXON_ID=44058 ORGANISM="Aureoumbra lagunensis, Strain CCMP1510" /NCGR_SAMPLE_ID=MMETSP0891 /ASSEMBLY_ACC=CAM_ASM_000534 /LENGTH=270 /DNA_ID=CAMNT_0042786505 /DNA_START=51 /DNA_END=863 /DNA_ORIENTATION=-